MPRTVETLRAMEKVDHAYILLIDGIPLAFTTDSSGELAGSGGSSYIGRAESDLGETVGGREIREGLIVPDTLEFGGSVNSIGLDRTDATFSILLTDDTAEYFILGGEEPEEMLGRLAPTDDPAPATVVGVTVRDRYLGLEYVGSAGERRMFPFIVGETLQGLDHHGDTDGATVPASVSIRPLVHEGRLCALYRVYRDPSATSTSNSDAWPSLSNYSPLWVGKLRDAGTITAGGRITLECTGFESLLERNMATGASQVFGVTPEFTAEAGVDDQVAIYCGTGPVLQTTGEQTAALTYQGRDWTTLAGNTREEIQSALNTLVEDTIAGVSTDYETGEPALTTISGVDAGVSPGSGSFFVKMDDNPSGDQYFVEVRVFMHRRRWLALGFEPEQQDATGGVAQTTEDQTEIPFTKLSFGGVLQPAPDKALMGEIPGTGYYGAQFHTIQVGANSGEVNRGLWDNQGAERLFDPLFPGAEVVRVIRPDGGQVIRMDTDAALLPQSHVPRSGSIEGTDTDAAGYFLIKGKIRKAEGSTDDASLVVEDETEQAVIARCSWVVRDELFADPGAAGSPALYIEQLYDPRHFGYPYRPLDRDWATLELQCVQLHTWTMGTAASSPERVDQTLCAMLRSTGTSTGPDGLGVIDQGDNSGTAVGVYGDIFATEMGLGVPSSLLPTQAEITDMFAELPNGAAGELARSRIAYESSFPSYEALRAMLEPRALRIGFDGGRFMLYRLRDASPEEATINILESDLYGEMGDPTTVYPTQRARALAPVDAWRFKFANDLEHEQRAKDPSASTRRGDNIRDVNGHGLIAAELYTGDSDAVPPGARWKNEARQLFGFDEARFLARRHGLVTVSVSRPKGQDIYPGTLVTLSNPWVRGADGTPGVSGVVGRVIRAVHHTDSAQVDADILVFEGQWRPPAHFAPALWIEAVTSTASATIATSSDFPMGGGSESGWTQPAWSSGAGGDLIGALIRMLPDGTWTVVGTAPVGSVGGGTVTFSAPLSAMPPDQARTMMLVPDVMANQPAWAQEIYSAVGIQGDNTRTRRFS